MSVLDAARRLAEAGLAEQWEPDTDSVGCPWCYATIAAASYSREQVEAHAEDCPWLQLPAIVRALEAAERVVQFGCLSPCVGCGRPVTSTNWEEVRPHREDCSWQALVDALSGAAGGGEQNSD